MTSQKRNLAGDGSTAPVPKRVCIETNPNDGVDSSSGIGTDEGLDYGKEETESDNQDQGADHQKILFFGMLYDIRIQPKELRLPSGKPTSGGSYISVPKVMLMPEHAMLQDSEGSEIGVFTQHMFLALTQLSSQYDVLFDALIPTERWKINIDTALKLDPRKRKCVEFTVDIIVMGPSLLGDHVARALANFGLFLQSPPTSLKIDRRYENPQSISFQNLPINYHSPSPGPELEHAQNSTTNWKKVLVPTVISCDNFEAFFDDLPTYTSASSVGISHVVKTNLLRHQTDGVAFIKQREQGENDPEGSLWIYKISPDRPPYFEHNITGGKSRVQEDTKGGILADEMGLGKTLTMLAAIVGSLELANQFSRTHTNNGSPFSKATLIIVPSELLLRTWEREIRSHTYTGSVRYTTYHGKERRQDESKIHEFDLVLTTYGTVVADSRRKREVLFRTHWYRLVLDEAHVIRNGATKVAKMARNISAHNKWCMTGTPVQNSLEDLGSLVGFLKVPILEDPATFRKYICRGEKIGDHEFSNYDNLRLLLGSICLRRNLSVLPSLGLDEVSRLLEFASQEARYYKQLESGFKQARDALANLKKTKKSSRNLVIEALLRLRMFCNNGTYQHKGQLLQGFQHFQPDEILSLLQQNDKAICGLCNSEIYILSWQPDSAYFTQCSRLICSTCLSQIRQDGKDPEIPKCILCQSTHGQGGLPYVPNERDNSPEASPTPWPTKIATVVQDIETHIRTDQCIVFSFWKQTLDILGKSLNASGIQYLRVDGGVPSKQRDEILLKFESRGQEFRVLLMTFSTGAYGLNGLTVASRIHILEPQWNPAVENQAIGRVLRIDQGRKVTVIKYIMKKSVEELVQSRQHHKLLLAKGGFTTESDTIGDEVALNEADMMDTSW